MAFQETRDARHPNWKKPIREMGIQIAGTPLESILAEFEAEVRAAGIRRVKPVFYFSDEWGVPFGTLTIAIPFYLARADLVGLHAEEVGYIEGKDRADMLRYLRHEMGHVVNYAYKLYEREDWVKQFGSINQPYVEEYRPEPFSPRFVRHLPGWYAQKHPDEDWAETFAVWMTPASTWRLDYAGWPEALAKLNLCERLIAEVAEREPLTAVTELDEDVATMPNSLEDYYRRYPAILSEPPPGLDGSLRAIFETFPEDAETNEMRPASQLVRRLESELMASIYRWTGHFPERTRALLRQCAGRADHLHQGYRHENETDAIVGLTTLVTALAMNHVHCGSYAPSKPAHRRLEPEHEGNDKTAH